MIDNHNQMPAKKILISNLNRIGIVHLHGIEKYLDRHDYQKCFLITPIAPHENVYKYAEKIPSLEIIISSDYAGEKKRIEEEHPEAKMFVIDAYHLAGRDGMLDA
ncbi:MAG TPA: hypothetical protein PKJ95_03520 [Atribacterota bacterium]|nr:hypothetical protein [Atribacterota bacterium]